MVDKYGVKWTREETILAFNLYCKTPFGKISKTNKDVIALAELLGRTPSSVGLKMANLAYFDPQIRKNNKTGMSNASKLDKEIVEEFNGDWEELSFQAQKILADIKNTDIMTLNPELENEIIPEGINKTSETKIRVGQQFFRETVLTAYGKTCCITGIKTPELLIASHIKPWKDSNSKTERTNPSNGLCLNALHDKAFDRGLITITKDYKIIISPKLSDVPMDDLTHEWFYSYNNQKINLPEKFVPGDNFLEYHNDVIFLR